MKPPLGFVVVPVVGRFVESPPCKPIRDDRCWSKTRRFCIMLKTLTTWQWASNDSMLNNVLQTSEIQQRLSCYPIKYASIRYPNVQPCIEGIWCVWSRCIVQIALIKCRRHTLCVRRTIAVIRVEYFRLRVVPNWHVAWMSSWYKTQTSSRWWTDIQWLGRRPIP